MTGMRAVLLSLAFTVCGIAQYPLTVTPYQVVYTSNGTAIPCLNCALYTYSAGTTTPLATYPSYTVTAPALPNPVRTNSAGYMVNGSNVTTGVWVPATSCYHLVLKTSLAVTVWDQDHVCNPAGVGANILALLAASSGSSLVGFLQSGTGAVAETVQTKLRQTVNVKDFGAVCDGGTTDDRAAIQNAINAVGAGTLVLPNGSPCGVSSPGLILYPTNGGVGKNSGITISGQSVYQNYNGAGGGLIAYASDPPTSILTVYAQNVNIQNLFIDCNSAASTYGIVSVFGLNSIWGNVATRNCSSDGARIDMFYTPVANVTAGGSAGSSAITLDSVTNNGICTFGNSSTAQTCSIIVFGYGTANQEAFNISSVSGKVVTISGTLAHDQTVARAQGNNNTMRINGYQAYGNGGWCFHEVFGSDNNAIVMSFPSCKGNTLGGELWENGSPRHYGGNYEGDTGPAIQLGITTASSGTAGGFIGVLADVEETTASGGVNAVVSVCDNQSTVQFHIPDDLIIKTGSSACAGFPNGTATVGYGQGQDSNGTPSLVLKTANGLVPLSIYRSTPGGTSTRCKYPGEIAFVPTGASIYAAFQYCSGSASLSITNTTNANPAVLTTATAPTTGFVYVTGYTNACQVLNGSWTATNISGTTFSIPVDSTSLGSCTGTPVFRTATWSSTSAPSSSCINGCVIQPDITGSGCANNTICVTYPDATGSTTWSQAAGNEIKVSLVNFTLRGAGTNSINVNGSVKAIGSNWNIANNIGTAVALGGVVDLILGNDGNWHLYGQ